MKKFLVAATFAALTITTSTTVSAKAKQAKPEVSIPVSDIALVYTDFLGYTTLQLKDYGCINDDPNNISYQEIKQMVNSYYVSIMETTDSVTVTEPNGNSWSIRK